MVGCDLRPKCLRKPLQVQFNHVLFVETPVLGHCAVLETALRGHMHGKCFFKRTPEGMRSRRVTCRSVCSYIFLPPHCQWISIYFNRIWTPNDFSRSILVKKCHILSWLLLPTDGVFVVFAPNLKTFRFASAWGASRKTRRGRKPVCGQKQVIRSDSKSITRMKCIVHWCCVHHSSLSEDPRLEWLVRSLLLPLLRPFFFGGGGRTMWNTRIASPSYQRSNSRARWDKRVEHLKNFERPLITCNTSRMW